MLVRAIEFLCMKSSLRSASWQQTNGRGGQLASLHDMARTLAVALLLLFFLGSATGNASSYDDCKKNYDEFMITCANLYWVTLPTMPVPQGMYYLVVTNSMIEEFPTDAINGPELQSITIRGNTAMKRLASDAFRTTPKMEIVEIIENRVLTFIDPNAFRGLNGLQILNLSANALPSVIPTWFSYSRNIDMLDMSSNKIETLPRETFKSIPKLLHLYISNNGLSTIDGLAFQGITGILNLVLKNNKLEQIPPQMMSLLRSLAMLDLSYNKLNSLPWSDMDKIIATKMKYLYLRNNNISNMPLAFLLKMPNLAELSLSSNSLYCDCTMDWLRKYLQYMYGPAAGSNRREFNEVKSMRWATVDRIACAAPPKYTVDHPMKFTDLCDVDECVTTRPCESVAICVDRIGGYECICGAGYFKNGLTGKCVDIDECFTPQRAPTPFRCSPYATCTNTPGNYTCECPPGFTGPGETCTDVNECAFNNGGCGTSTCVNTIGSFSCGCKKGFMLRGGECVDVDECATPSHGCKVACFNAIGTYYCDCMPGFQYTSGKCVDIDECANKPCGTYAICKNTIGSYQCFCPPGFSGNGTVCTDLDECITRKPCNKQATCTNTIGSFQCRCPAGHHGTGLLKSTCTDIDECLQSPCGQYSICVNIKGSYHCACSSGFQRAGGACTDVNECTLRPPRCHVNATCTNTRGSFNCKCRSGFTGDGKTSCKAGPKLNIQKVIADSEQSSSKGNGNLVTILALGIGGLIILALVTLLFVTKPDCLFRRGQKDYRALARGKEGKGLMPDEDLTDEE